MKDERPIRIMCRFRPGAFPSECMATIGDVNVGPIPLPYCWRQSGEPLGQVMHRANAWMDGLLLCQTEAGCYVEVPSGERLWVSPGFVLVQEFRWVPLAQDSALSEGARREEVSG